MKLTVEEWPIERLRDYERNPRKNDHAVDGMVKQIEEFGFRVPVVAKSDGLVVDGHLRLKAARKMGMASVPVALADDLTEAQIKAFRIAVNKTAEWAQWDGALLRVELDDLKSGGFDLALTGFGDIELAGIFADKTAGLTDPDEAPEAPNEPVTVLGDVWLLGSHRLMCGDSTSATHIGKLMAGSEADLCFTSPPYGQQRDYKNGGILDWEALMRGVFGALPLKNDGQLLVNLGLIHRDGEWIPYWESWVEWMRSGGWRRFGWYVWDQGPGLPGDWNGRLAPSHEFVFHFNRVAERARKTKAKLAASIQFNDHGNGMRRKDGTMSGVSSPEKSLQPNKVPDSVIRVMRHKARGIETAHPAVFPVELVAEIQTAFSDAGDVVFEPFSGSGTQLISSEKNGRVCMAMEIAPSYIDVAVTRWQNFTGKSATLESTGETFVETMARRQPNAKISASLGLPTSATKTASRGRPKAGHLPPISGLTTDAIAS